MNNVVQGQSETGVYPVTCNGKGDEIEVSTTPIGRDRVALVIYAFGMPVSIKVSVETLTRLQCHLTRALIWTKQGKDDATENEVSG